MLLTATQLYDLSLDLVKAKKQATKTGPRGGRFYLTQTGEKIYPGEVKADPPLLLHVASAPHLGKTHQNVEVRIAPGKKEPSEFKQRMQISPDRQSRRAYAQAQQSSNWPAYFCRDCKSAIVPNHDHPVTVKRAIKNPRTGKTETHVEEILGHTTEVMKVDSKTGEKKWISPPDPAAVAQKRCPDCYSKSEVLSREITGRTPALKPTKRSREVVRERKSTEKRLQIVLAKPENKRTTEQQKIVDEHQAIASTKKRAEEARIKAQGVPTAERREKEATWAENKETGAKAQLRDKFKNHLIKQGMDASEAELASLSLTDEDVREFQSQQAREKAAHRTETAKRVGEEVAGKEISRVVGLGDLLDLMARRRHGVSGSEEQHGLTVEGLKPVKAREAERLRTQRLRERKETEKSFSLWVCA